MRYITLEDANETLRAAFGDDVKIVLEPIKTYLDKLNADQGDQLWCFDPVRGVIGRGDQRFFEIRMVNRGGYVQPALYQEPNVPQPVDGSPRIVGQVIVRIKPGLDMWMVKFRRVQGLEGEVLELAPSSFSNGEPVDGEVTLRRKFFNVDPQRASGFIEAIRVDDDTFPDGEAMPLDVFKATTNDGRSLAALAALGL